MTTPFEEPRKIANNVKSGKWTTPILVVVGVGAAAWYMASQRHEQKPVSPDRDPRAPPSKMSPPPHPTK